MNCVANGLVRQDACLYYDTPAINFNKLLMFLRFFIDSILPFSKRLDSKRLSRPVAFADAVALNGMEWNGIDAAVDG